MKNTWWVACSGYTEQDVDDHRDWFVTMATTAKSAKLELSNTIEYRGLDPKRFIDGGVFEFSSREADCKFAAQRRGI